MAGHVNTTRVHVHTTAIPIIRGFTAAARQRKMLFGFFLLADQVTVDLD